LIEKLPHAVLNIYGAILLKSIAVNVKDGFLIRGRAADANEVVQQARVVLAPLRLVLELKEN
jgi:hypothetical protein